MNTLRFSLAKMLAAVVLVALGLAALVNATPIWAGAVTSAAVFLLFVAVVGLIYRRHADRAFWVGFAVFDWGYLAVIYAPSPWALWRYRLDRELDLGNQLLTTQVLDWGARQVRGLTKGTRVIVEWTSGSWYPGSIVEVDNDRVHVRFDDGDDRWVIATQIKTTRATDFVRIGQSMFALLLGFVGGVIARCFYATTQRKSSAGS